MPPALSPECGPDAESSILGLCGVPIPSSKDQGRLNFGIASVAWHLGAARLLGVARSTVYSGPQPVPVSDLSTIRWIDELHLDHPFGGCRTLRSTLVNEDIAIGRTHVRTLMRRMGIEAVYRRPRTSQPGPGHKFYPYLLRDVAVIGRCMQCHRHQEFIRFLNATEAAVPKGKAIHAIVDNYATHKHPKVKEWLARHPRWTFHFTLTSASWLNAVEGFFAKLSKRRLN